MRDLFDFRELICNRLRNKCAMTCGAKKVLSLGGESGCLNEGNYNHERGLKPELININPLTRTYNAHIHSQRTAPSPTRGEGKEGCVGDMNQNIFNDTDFSCFTSLFPPYSPIALLPYKECQMGENL